MYGILFFEGMGFTGAGHGTDFFAAALTSPALTAGVIAHEPNSTHFAWQNWTAGFADREAAQTRVHGFGTFLGILTIPVTIASGWFFAFRLISRLQIHVAVEILVIPVVACGIPPSIFLTWLLKLCGIRYKRS